MSGWDEVRRVQLAAPWDEFWVECNSNLPMGDLFDIQEAGETLGQGATRSSIESIVSLIAHLVVAHNIVDRDGNPLTFSLRSMSPSLIVAVVSAIGLAQGGEGEAVDPLVKKRVPLRDHLSPARKSRRASASTS